MKDTRQKKIQQINISTGSRTLQLVIQNEKAYVTIDGAKPKPLYSLSRLTICLVRNLNHPVPNNILKQQFAEDLERKSFLNKFNNMKDLFNQLGPEYIVTDGSGDTYTAMFRTDEHCEVIYDDSAYEATAEYQLQDALAGKCFDTEEDLTGGLKLRRDLIPGCTFGGVSYTSMSHMVYSVFVGNPLYNALILTGDGGAGKTCSLFDTYRRGEDQGVRTIYVHAEGLDSEEHNLIRHIALRSLKVTDYHQQIHGFETFVRDSSFPILLLIDGLNEVSDSRKLKYCIQSFRYLNVQFPDRFYAIFASRYPQAVKAQLGSAQTVTLQPLAALKFKDINQKMLKKLHIPLTPLIKIILEELSQEDASQIHSRYDLYCRYFDHLTESADRKDGSGWIYPVLSAVAAASMEGQHIDSRWLKRFCSPAADYDFIHRYCAGEEYPLEDSSSAELLKSTGFLQRDRLDIYRIHQQYRDFLTVRYGMMQVREEEISMSEFLLKMADATRYYTLGNHEHADDINARRHNNLDLGEFAFYAGIAYRKEHPEDYTVLPHLLQLGIQIAYLYDNVECWPQLFSLYSSLKEIHKACLDSGPLTPLLHQSLPGYYFCLNKLVDKSRRMEELDGACSWTDFSAEVEEGYLALLQRETGENPEWKAVLCSGLGGVYLSRFHIMDKYEDKSSCLSHAVKYHTDALRLRRQINSSKLFRSHVALGTSYFYKGQLYLSNEQEDLHKEAVNVFREAASHHKTAAGFDTNTEKYVAWSRIAGCWYEILLLTGSEETGEEAREQLYAAAASAYNSLQAAISASGVTRHSSAIKSQLLDLSKYMQVLSFQEPDFRFIDHLCGLYHQAYSSEKAPQRSADNKRIIFYS